MQRTTDAGVALCVVLAVWSAADLPHVVAAAWPEGEAWRIARRAKYVADGASHALLLALVLHLAQRLMRGWPLTVCAAAVLYGAAHGIMQAACGYAAYFTDRAAVRAAGGLCERAHGWEPITVTAAALVGLVILWRSRCGRH